MFVSRSSNNVYSFYESFSDHHRNRMDKHEMYDFKKFLLMVYKRSDMKEVSPELNDYIVDVIISCETVSSNRCFIDFIDFVCSYLVKNKSTKNIKKNIEAVESLNPRSFSLKRVLNHFIRNGFMKPVYKLSECTGFNDVIYDIIEEELKTNGSRSYDVYRALISLKIDVNFCYDDGESIFIKCLKYTRCGKCCFATLEKGIDISHGKFEVIDKRNNVHILTSMDAVNFFDVLCGSNLYEKIVSIYPSYRIRPKRIKRIINIVNSCKKKD